MAEGNKNNTQNYMYMKDQGIQDRNASKTYDYQDQHLDLLDDIYQVLIDTKKEVYTQKNKGGTPSWGQQTASSGGSKLDVAEQARLVRTRDKKNQEYRSAMLEGMTNLNTTFAGKIDGLHKAMKKADYNPYKMLMGRLSSSLVGLLTKAGLPALLSKGGLKAAAVAAVAVGGYKLGGVVYDKWLKGPMNDWVDAYAEKENNLQRTQSVHMQSQIKKLNRLVELGEMSQGMAKEEISLERNRVAILEGMRMIGNLSDEEYLNALTDKDKYTIDVLQGIIRDKELLKKDFFIETGLETRGREMIAQSLKFIEKDKKDLKEETAKFEEKKRIEEEKKRREKSIQTQSVRNKSGMGLFERTRGKMSQQDLENIGTEGLKSAHGLFQQDYDKLKGMSQQELVKFMYKSAIRGAKTDITQQAATEKSGVIGSNAYINEQITKLESKIAKRTKEDRMVSSRDINSLKQYKQDLKDNAKERKELNSTIKRLTDLLESGKIGNNVVTSQKSDTYIIGKTGDPKNPPK